MKDFLVDQFQYTVQDLLVRNKSILDSLTKFQDSNAKTNRAIVKAATQCGCIKITAEKKQLPEGSSLEDMKQVAETHVEGKLCENCRETIESEMGKNLFYLVSLCNTLDLNLYDIIIQEEARVKMLGQYNLR